VLIVTTADAEMEAVVGSLENAQLVGSIDKIPVTIGELGGRRVAVCQTQQSSTQTHAVVLALLGSDELKDNVRLVLAIGIAWGANPASEGGDQLVGDVLVASRFVDAGHVKVKDGETTVRGAVTANAIAHSVNALLCRDWPGESKTHFGQGIAVPVDPRRPKVHVGTAVSLPALIDDKEAAMSLIEHQQVAPHKPIGGEMELYQVAAAAEFCGKRWFLSKGISDYAGVDDAKSKSSQPLAAAAAVDFADWVLRQPVMDAHLSSSVVVE